jgi:poly-gamma-glutamate synthesis protein (capsule biosynthesis protein)
VKVLIAGDFCPQNRVARLFNHNDFASVLSETREVVCCADYSIVNLECPVTKGGERPITKWGTNLQCSEKGLEALRWAGFECLALANNHFWDFGEDGVENTLAACRKYGFDTVGGGINLQEASKILYKNIEGNILAIINCCEHEFSIATETTAGSNPLNPIQQYYAIQEARKNADFVLVIVHGGHEYYQLPSPRMQETYRFFIDAGADTVVNHHQHCFSGFEVYKEKPIFYGLGNFCFDTEICVNKKWNEGYMVLFHIGAAKSFEIIPYNQCSEQARIRLLNRSAFDEDLEKINAIISDHLKLKNAVDRYYASCTSYLSEIFEPSNNRYYLACRQRGWLPSFISISRKLRATNSICCESHLDKLKYYLNQS